ncbi:unnamed protein product, partial [Mycena citricolor]
AETTLIDFTAMGQVLTHLGRPKYMDDPHRKVRTQLCDGPELVTSRLSGYGQGLLTLTYNAGAAKLRTPTETTLGTEASWSSQREPRKRANHRWQLPRSNCCCGSKCRR